MSRSARIERITSPTMPVAPTTPIRACSVVMVVSALDGRVAEVEGGVERAHCVLDGLLRHVAGDLDRGGRDDGGVDPELGERRERLRCDARMALHPRADDGHLAEVVTRAPVDAEAVERARGGGGVLDGCREEDLLRAGLQDR